LRIYNRRDSDTAGLQAGNRKLNREVAKDAKSPAKAPKAGTGTRMQKDFSFPKLCWTWPCEILPRSC